MDVQQGTSNGFLQASQLNGTIPANCDIGTLDNSAQSAMAAAQAFQTAYFTQSLHFHAPPIAMPQLDYAQPAGSNLSLKNELPSVPLSVGSANFLEQPQWNSTWAGKYNAFAFPATTPAIANPAAPSTLLTQNAPTGHSFASFGYNYLHPSPCVPQWFLNTTGTSNAVQEAAVANGQPICQSEPESLVLNNTEEEKPMLKAGRKMAKAEIDGPIELPAVRRISHARSRFGPGTNNLKVRTKDQYRIVYTEYQRIELEREFATNQFINSQRKAQLSTELQLTERQIKIWFQNRRAKERRVIKQRSALPLPPLPIPHPPPPHHAQHHRHFLMNMNSF